MDESRGGWSAIDVLLVATAIAIAMAKTRRRLVRGIGGGSGLKAEMRVKLIETSVDDGNVIILRRLRAFSRPKCGFGRTVVTTCPVYSAKNEKEKW